MPDLPESRRFTSQVDARNYLVHSHLPLTLYGSGGTAAELWWTFKNLFGKIVDAVCDSNPARQGRMFHSLEILAPEEMVRRFPDANVLVAVVGAHEDAVRGALHSLGVRRDRIFGGRQIFALSPVEPIGFSVCPHRDFYRFGRRLADDVSQALFWTRYRHWLLGDRPDNPASGGMPDVLIATMGNGEALPSESDRVLCYADASELCCDVDWYGEALACREVLLEFDNRDLLARRAMMTLFRFRPDGAFLLREGGKADTTRFWSLARGGVRGI